MTTRLWKGGGAALAVLFAACAVESPARAATEARAVIDNYADIAQAGY